MWNGEAREEQEDELSEHQMLILGHNDLINSINLKNKRLSHPSICWQASQLTSKWHIKLLSLIYYFDGLLQFLKIFTWIVNRLVQGILIDGENHTRFIQTRYFLRIALARSLWKTKKQKTKANNIFIFLFG